MPTPHCAHQGAHRPPLPQMSFPLSRSLPNRYPLVPKGIPLAVIPTESTRRREAFQIAPTSRVSRRETLKEGASRGCESSASARSRSSGNVVGAVRHNVVRRQRQQSPRLNPKAPAIDFRLPSTSARHLAADAASILSPALS